MEGPHYQAPSLSPVYLWSPFRTTGQAVFWPHILDLLEICIGSSFFVQNQSLSFSLLSFGFISSIFKVLLCFHIFSYKNTWTYFSCWVEMLPRYSPGCLLCGSFLCGGVVVVISCFLSSFSFASSSRWTTTVLPFLFRFSPGQHSGIINIRQWKSICLGTVAIPVVQPCHRCSCAIQGCSHNHSHNLSYEGRTAEQTPLAFFGKFSGTCVCLAATVLHCRCVVIQLSASVWDAGSEKSCWGAEYCFVCWKTRWQSIQIKLGKLILQ